MSPLDRNVDHQRRLAFVHNPKAAGSSFRAWLGFRGPTDHRFPTYSLSSSIWNDYIVVVFVRHPLQRFYSAYLYHTSPKYRGAHYAKHPEIHGWSIDRYLDFVMHDEPRALPPQYLYTVHLHSPKPADHVLKVEHLGGLDLSALFGVAAPFPHRNRTARFSSSVPPIAPSLREKLRDFYRRDYLLFGYDDEPGFENQKVA